MAATDLIAGARLLWNLPRFLRHPIDPRQARVVLSQRRRQRGADFLALARRTIYQNPRSPYRPLLAWAGCEYGDLEQLVGREGVEGALEALLRHGVYLDVEELKGRRPVVRGTTVFTIDPNDFANPGSTYHVPAQSGASSGAAVPVHTDLAFIRDSAVNGCLDLEARGGAHWSHGVWGVPGGAAMRQLFYLAGSGGRVARWFTQVDPGAPDLHPRYLWSARLAWWASQVAGRPLPFPEFVALSDPLPIARWMMEVLAAGGVPHLMTFGSSAVRLSQCALDAGYDLSGVQLAIGGEPITDARLDVIRRAGAHAVPRCGSRECGAIATACHAPVVADDLHLFDDLHAVIQAGAEGTSHGLPARAILISSLRASAPLVLLNASLGDRAVLERRLCGCPLEALGWATHLHTIRSHQKLTAGGMSFLDADAVGILETVLPARFGGGPSDYQLVEDVDGGAPRLRLLVSPSVGDVDEDAVARVFLAALGEGSGVEQITSRVWDDARLVRIERRLPIGTASGKILHLHHLRARDTLGAEADQSPLENV